MLNFLDENSSYEFFINKDSSISELDLSNLDLKQKVNILDNLINLKVLKLKKINLNSLEDIKLFSFTKLIHLDLSHNNLKYLDSFSFRQLTNLEYLDLSFNQIENIDPDFFSFKTNQMKKLRYLNLENNFIKSIGDLFLNYQNIEFFKISNNYLTKFPYFDVGLIGNFQLVISNFYFNNNNISKIEKISIWISNLKILNFDFNYIEFIENDAFIYLKNLENLSIAFNNLNQIYSNNFIYLFSLKFLNLSHNQIELIEADSFQNLNKLLILDLSFNRLTSIDNNLFQGLINLNDLYLLNENNFQFYNKSFDHLEKVNRIFFNELIFKKNETYCYFINSIKRIIQRQISNKYIFYKSFNLITQSPENGKNISNWCDLTFHFLQFKIHFNLLTDNDFELFVENCQREFI
jgi:Leucine-rich repeat (LRR) protein